MFAKLGWSHTDYNTVYKGGWLTEESYLWSFFSTFYSAICTRFTTFFRSEISRAQFSFMLLYAKLNEKYQIFDVAFWIESWRRHDVFLACVVSEKHYFRSILVSDQAGSVMIHTHTSPLYQQPLISKASIDLSIGNVWFPPVPGPKFSPVCLLVFVCFAPALILIRIPPTLAISYRFSE